MKRLHPRTVYQHLPLALLALAVLLYAGYFSWLTLLRYHAFEARALDLGNLNQAVWNTAHGNWFRLTNQEEGLTSRLGYHVEPIILPIALIYRLYPAPELLLVLQALVVALGAVPLFALARLRGLHDWLGLLLGVAFLLNPTMQAANWYEFHPVTLAPTFFMATFYFLLARRTGWFVLFAALSASCKEEMGLLVFMIGLYAWLAQRRRYLGWLTMAAGLGWSLFAVLGIQQLIAGGNIHWGRYAYLGESTADKLVALVTRPDLLLAQLQQARALSYLFWLLLPVGFTALLAPEVLVLALPSLAINLLADFSPMHEPARLTYAAPLVPFVMLAGAMGIARLAAWTRQTHRQLQAEGERKENQAGLDEAAPGTVTEREGSRNRLRPSRSSLALLTNWLVAVLVLGGVLTGQWTYGYLPGSGQYLAMTVTEHHRRGQLILDEIPANAKVSAQDRLNPHVSGRETLYLFPRLEDADTVVLDASGPAWPLHPNDLRQRVDDLLAGDFGVARAADGYLVLSTNTSNKSLPPAFFTAWQAPDKLDTSLPEVSYSEPVHITFGDEITLLEYAVGRDRYGELVVSTVWETLEPLEQDLRFYISYLDTELNVLHDSQFYQPTAVLWYPTSLWQPGSPVLVQTLPWTLDTERFVLVVGVYRGESGWRDGARLPVTSMEPDVPLMDDRTLVRLAGFGREDGVSWQPQLAVDGAPARQLDATFEGGLRLEGVTAPPALSPGQPAPVTLYWQADQVPAGDYSVFVHLLDSSGSKVGQLDGMPGDGISKLPTSAWPAGWRGSDSRLLALPGDLQPGDYTLVAGMYVWQTLERLPIRDPGAAPGDVVVLGNITVR